MTENPSPNQMHEAKAREIDVTTVTKEKIETIPLDKYLE